MIAICIVALSVSHNPVLAACPKPECQEAAPIYLHSRGMDGIRFVWIDSGLGDGSQCVAREK